MEATTYPQLATRGRIMARHVINREGTTDSLSSESPKITNYQLLRLIGKGSYGEVWLAKNLLGTFQAVKLVYRSNFSDQRPFEREFDGLRRFEPISHRHGGWVRILHVGRSEAGDYFYYVMEVADDVVKGRAIEPSEYQSETLRRKLAEHGRLPVNDCLRLGISLVAALGELHRCGLIHRDIKPSNIIFIDGLAKLADIGLVATIGEENSAVGTDGYRPVHGQGTPGGDLFSLGMVLYVAAMGKDPGQFPELPTDTSPWRDGKRLLQLNAVILRACNFDPHKRFLSATAMHKELVSLLTDDAPMAPQPESMSSKSPFQPPLEQEGGAIPLDSLFYVVRPADDEFQAALNRHDSIVLVRGARQMGKTSLLARGVQQARNQGVRVALTDCQELNTSQFQSLRSFYHALGDSLAEQLKLDVSLGDLWDARHGSNMNFDRYLRRDVLGKFDTHLVWALDEVDRLFTCAFFGDVFGLFRSWHNKRSLDPHGPWGRLTLAIAYATEAHLFITDLNQSPFNVGTRLSLDDFDLDQVSDLNVRYGSPLKAETEVERFTRLVSGQPYLVRRGLYELATQGIRFEELEAQADRDEGIFGDHLRRILLSLSKDQRLLEVVHGVLRGNAQVDPDSFYRLRSAGVLTGDSERTVRPRCQVYAKYLERHLA